jgi:hypothetical protein
MAKVFSCENISLKEVGYDLQRTLGIDRIITFKIFEFEDEPTG